MESLKKITAAIFTNAELNHSYMPFINGGGLFIPTNENFTLGEKLNVDLQLPNQPSALKIEGTIIWITPKHALYQARQGIGIQFNGAQAKAYCHQIEANLDANIEVGGYAYWIDEDLNN